MYLTQSTAFSSQLGTRHRAAIGMTENSDAVVLIVSEETGIISITFNGEIKRNFTAKTACEFIKEKIVDENKDNSANAFKRIFKILFSKNDKIDENKEEKNNEN